MLSHDRRPRFQKAFTIIELLIVIAIVTILCASAGSFATRLLNHGQSVAARLADDEQARYAFQHLRIDIAAATSINMEAADQSLLMHRPTENGRYVLVKYTLSKSKEYFRTELRTGDEKYETRMLQHVVSIKWTPMSGGYKLVLNTFIEDGTQHVEKTHSAFFASLSGADKETSNVQ